ncbi:F-box only protein 9, partial [Nowakowskiella sp. JEL0078]
MGNLSEALKLYRNASRLDPNVEWVYRKTWQHRLTSEESHDEPTDPANDHTSFYNYYTFTQTTDQHFPSILDNLAYFYKTTDLKISPKSENSRKTWMHRLPTELIGRIIQWTLAKDMSTLCSLSLVCKVYFVETRERTVWRFLCDRYHGKKVIDGLARVDKGLDWVDVFLDRPRVRLDG